MEYYSKKKVKTFLTLSILFSNLFSLSSCNESKFLEKPDNTNLEFWITEEVAEKDFLKCTFLPGLFGGSMYLDSRYNAINKDDESKMAEAPKIHVVYTLIAYPDYSDNTTYVTSIEITDSNINVYDLSMTSSDDEISKTMSNLGFINDELNRWSKNNCVFIFNESKISISAKVTNNKGIVF